MLAALVSWALASPVGSTPDEDYHLASIWCAHGLEPGRCEAVADPTRRSLPSKLVAAHCYAFDGNRSAACQATESRKGTMAETRGNWHGKGYPPVFYWIEGLLVSDDVTNSVLLMRLVNTLLFVGLIAVVYALVPAGLSRPLVGGALIAAVPLGMFLVPSINPSSWAILSAITLPVCLVGCLTATDRRRRYALGSLAVLSLLLGAGARADAAVYGIVAVGVTVLLTVPLRLDARSLRMLVLPTILAIGAAVAFLTTGQSATIDADRWSPQRFSLGRLVKTVADVPSLFIGNFGTWFGTGGLGWLDFALPSVVWVSSWSAFVAVLFVAVTGAGMRMRLSLALIVLAAVFVPGYILFSQGLQAGVGVQPRYVLPLMSMLGVTAMIRLSGSTFRLTGGQRWLVVTALTIANADALHTNIKRYTVGLDGLSMNLDRYIEWWWQIPISPMTLWFLGSLAFGVAATLLTSEFVVAAAAAGTTDAAAGPTDTDAADTAVGTTDAADTGSPDVSATGGTEQTRDDRQPPAASKQAVGSASRE